MDPQQTWTDMLEALKNKQWDEAKELADALYAWIGKGGFPPTTVGDESLGKNWHKTIAHFTCLAVTNKAEEVRTQRAKRAAKKGGG